MTKKKNTNTPFVINPLTNRSIRVGGKVYNNLVRQGYFQDEYVDDKILEEVGEKETENINLMKEKIEELDERLPIDLQAVRGRGRYKNKLVKRYRKRSKKPKRESVNKTISSERKQARELLDLLRGLDEDKDIESQLAELIAQSGEIEEELEDVENSEEELEDVENSEDCSDDEY